VIAIHDATPDRWPDVVTVMGTRGDPSRCWCQLFRIPGAGWDRATAPAMRDALHEQVRGDVPPGVLAVRDDEPVGWCAVAPRGSYPRLGRSTVAQATDDGPGVWAGSGWCPGMPRQPNTALAGGVKATPALVA